VCAAIPCSGLAFNVTYRVVGVTPSTTIHLGPQAGGCSVSSVSSPPNACVQVVNAIGTTLTESTQDGTVMQTHAVDPTLTSVSCTPSPVVLTIGNFAACTATANDIAASGRVPSIGTVKFSSRGNGVFNPNTCELSPINTSASQCQVSYQPLGVGALANGVGIHIIDVIYDASSDLIHSGSTASGQLSVSPDQTMISTAVINSQTGLALNSTLPLGVNSTIPEGIPVFARAILLNGFGFNGGLGVTGTLTYSLYPNGACTAGTGTVISTSPVAGADQVPDSAKVTPSPAGTFSINAFYQNVTTDNLPSAIGVTSNCASFIVTPAPAFTAGKLHWTHHLSLSKSASTQSWTAIVTNPLSKTCLLYTSPSPRDLSTSRMPSSA